MVVSECSGSSFPLTCQLELMKHPFETFRAEEDKATLVEILQHLPDAENISTFASQFVASPLLTPKDSIESKGMFPLHA